MCVSVCVCVCVVHAVLCSVSSPAACQCNGHSQCVNESMCEKCEDLTTGRHCESCISGFYGDPTNGGSCQREYRPPRELNRSAAASFNLPVFYSSVLCRPFSWFLAAQQSVPGDVKDLLGSVSQSDKQINRPVPPQLN